MSNPIPNSESPEHRARPLTNTEFSWCKSVPGGTGITVVALLFSKPLEIPLLRSSLHRILTSNPILRSTIRSNAKKSASFIIPATPHLEIEQFDLESTSRILRDKSGPHNHLVEPFHLILEHEMNRNPWSCNSDNTIDTDFKVFFATVYTLSELQWTVALRLHNAACDRTTAGVLLKELVGILGGKEEKVEMEYGNGSEVNLGIEDLIPKRKKSIWARGVNLVGYSLNSFRLSNLDFVDANSPRSSHLVSLKMNIDETDRLLSGCKSRGIKPCGALAAAGLIAVYSSKHLLEHNREKYAVVTLVDCRSALEPALSSHSPGFYHSAILNTHNVNGGEKLWELAKKTYTAFANAKNGNKHFSDMGDLNFLMCKAIDNPGLTASFSSRTSVLSVFEEPEIYDSNEMHQEIGLEDYVGCASVHGVGPSIALFTTIRDGALDCACVYPSPVHSREQMKDLVDKMKRILVDASNDL